jgi:hypothetical protein
MTRISELGTTLAATSNQRVGSPILVTLMKKALGSLKHRFLQEPHGITSQKTPFFKALDTHKTISEYQEGFQHIL